MGKWCAKHKFFVGGTVLLAILIALAILVPLLAPGSYSTQVVALKNQGSTWAHPFGSDRLGRDIFIRVWYGMRISLFIGLSGALLNGVIGTLYGGFAGYRGGRVDALFMRIADVIASIPSLLYTILIVLAVGANVGGMLLGLCVSGWISTARIARGAVRNIKYKDYIEAARLSGAPRRVLFFKHLLIGAIGPVIVNITFLVPQMIFTEAFLSFTGIGISAPVASIGALIQDARSQIQLYPSQMLYPILILSLLVISINFIGVDLERMVQTRRGGQ